MLTGKLLELGFHMTAKDQQYWLGPDFVLELLKQLPSYVFWKNTDSIYLGCNDAFAKAVGLNSPLEIIGKTDYDLPIQMKEIASYQADDQLVMSSKCPKLNIEETQTFPDGQTVVLLTSKVPLCNNKGEVIGVLGIYSDITERKKLEEDLRNAKEKAEEANRLKTQFIQNMEHDIRTPFNGVYSLASFLHENIDALSKEEEKEMLGDIVASAQLLLSYCNNILDFAKTSEGELPVVAKKFDLICLIDNIVILEKPAIKSKDLQLNLQLPEDIPNILIGDEYRLQQILINLLGNAVKFTNKGQIDLNVNVVKRENKDIILRFTIRDTGIGIPQNKQLLIFEKFTRLESSNKGIFKGLGLGLSIVKQYVEELEGEIDLKSEIGQGTSFICTLPFKLPLVDELIS